LRYSGGLGLPRAYLANPAHAPAGGARVHGVHLGMGVKHGVVPGWDLDVLDASAVEDEVRCGEGRGG